MNLSDKGELNNIAGISSDFSMDVTNSVMEFDDFSWVMIDGAVRKPFLLYGRYGSLSGYIVLPTSDVKLINA